MKTITEYIQKKHITDNVDNNMIANFETICNKDISKNFCLKYSESNDPHLYMKATQFKDDDCEKPMQFKDKYTFNEYDFENLCNALKENNLSDLYFVIGKYSYIDTSSRINNLRRTKICIFMPSTGMLFNNKKECNKWLNANRDEMKRLYHYSTVFKVYNAEEILNNADTSTAFKITQFGPSMDYAILL